jgi:hypothetical protein
LTALPTFKPKYLTEILFRTYICVDFFKVKHSNIRYSARLLILQQIETAVVAQAVKRLHHNNEFESQPVETKDVDISIDSSLAMHPAFKKFENHGSFGYDLESGGPVSQ